MEALERQEAGLELYGSLVNNLRFAHDINLMYETTNGLQEKTDQVSQQERDSVWSSAVAKTKVMTISKDHPDLPVDSSEKQQIGAGPRGLFILEVRFHKTEDASQK